MQLGDLLTYSVNGLGSQAMSSGPLQETSFCYSSSSQSPSFRVILHYVNYPCNLHVLLLRNFEVCYFVGV